MLNNPDNRLNEMSINIKGLDCEVDFSTDLFAEVLDYIDRFHKLPSGDDVVSIYGADTKAFQQVFEGGLDETLDNHGVLYKKSYDQANHTLFYRRE